MVTGVVVALAGVVATIAAIAAVSTTAAVAAAAAPSPASPPSLLEILPPPGAVEGWTPAGEPQLFAADDLWRHIDGAADQVLLFGCTGMAVAYYAPAGGGSRGAPGGSEVCVEIYEMADSLGSFGLYSLERPRVEACLPLGAQGHLAGGEIGFWGGRYYVKVRSQPDGEAERDAAHALAERIAADHLRGSEPPADLALFPNEHLAEEPFGFAARAALSLEGMDRALTAKYRVGAAEMVVHLARASDPAEAEAMHAVVRASFERRSAAPLASLSVGGVPAESAELKYRGAALLLRHGAFVILAAPVPAEPWAAATIAALIANLSR